MIRVSTAASNITLETHVLGSPPARAVVAPPHPLYGGHFSNPVVQAIAKGLVRRGSSVLVFNWRGIGESDGHTSGDLGAACEDYRAALAHVVGAGVSVSRVIAAGYSFGAAVALAVALDEPLVSEVIVVAPPVAMLPAGLTRATRPLRTHVIAAAHDEFCPIADLERALGSVTDARMTVIDGADHFFASVGVDEIVAAVSSTR